MSSESDDDFQSADEGSDVEDIQRPIMQKPALSQLAKPEVTSSSKDIKYDVDKIEPVVKSARKEASFELHDPMLDKECSVDDDTSLMGTLRDLSVRVNEQLSLSKSVADTVDNQSEDEESDTISDDGDTLECNVKTFPGVFTADNKCQITEIKDSEDWSRDHVDDVHKSTEELSALDINRGVLENTEISKNLKENISVTELENKEPQRIEESYTSEEKAVEENPTVSMCESKESVGSEAQEKPTLENVHFEAQEKSTLGKVDEAKKDVDPKPVTQKPKPIRESKIGMKKPREKLGERLGAKKLGSKIDKKPMEGLGCETIKQVQPASDKRSPTQSGLEQGRFIHGGEKKLVDEFSRQEERWQQAQSTNDNRKMNEIKEGNSDWGSPWGNWGTTLISAASSITQEVGRGVGTIMDTVEGSLGVPDPETLAKEMSEREKEYQLYMKEQEKSIEKRMQDSVEETKESRDKNTEVGSARTDFSLGGFSSFGSLVSGVSGVFETASNKVLMGGLDTLEVIGRKAMDVIQDGDPGLRKKRAFITNPRPNLSAVLREARHQAEEEKNQQEGNFGKDGSRGSQHKITFDSFWDAGEGCVHFEALSLVARQCESKMSSMFQTMPHYLVERIQSANNEIKDACELEEDCILEDDFISRVEEILPLIGLPVHSHKICDAWKKLEETTTSLKETDDSNKLRGPTVEEELYQCLAYLIAQLAAIIHKGAELALITPGADPVNVAEQFKELSSVTSGGIENTADNICGILSTGDFASEPQTNNTITNIYLQTANGNGYVRQCMKHLSSVLQYSRTKHMAADL